MLKISLDFNVISLRLTFMVVAAAVGIA